MKSPNPALAFSLLAAVVLAAPGAAAALVFTATLSGSQEVPTVLTSATGSVTVILNPYQDASGPVFLMDLQASFSGLSSGWTSAGLYGPAGPGQTGPLVLDIGPVSGPTPPPPGATSGTFGVMDQQLTPDALAALNAGQIYFNLRSITHPNGEIRGQLLPVPEPTVALCLLGTAFLATRRRRPVFSRS